MFEAAELGQKISKKEFAEAEPALHTKLLEVQRQLRKTNIPVIVIVSGVEGAGKGAVVNRLNEWLDARGIRTVAFWDESDEETERPPYWRFWRQLPPRGTVGILFGSWYTKPIIDHVYGRIDQPEYERQLRRISEFEELLTIDGALIVIGGDGSLRGARALFERFGTQVVALPGSIDNNIRGTTALGFHSAVALANQSLESLKATSAAMGSIFFVEIMGAGSGHLALACAYQARAEGVLVNEHPDPDAYIDQVILGTLRQSLGVPNKSHLFVVAERTPHRHDPEGGVHGLTRYVAQAISGWPQLQNGPARYPLTATTKATILGHTLRGAPPAPEDKALAQTLAYEAVRRLVERPETIVGCFLARRGEEPVETIPLHAVAPKPFDWELFSRIHGIE